MRLAATLAAGAALVCGCASTDTAETPPSGRVTYSCDRGPGITVVYAPGEARIEGANGQVIVLPQRVSGSGVWYESPTHSLRGKVDWMTYTVGRMAPMRCRAN